jgi:hypothetical protein
VRTFIDSPAEDPDGELQKLGGAAAVITTATAGTRAITGAGVRWYSSKASNRWHS